MSTERAKKSKFKVNDLSGVYAASSPMRRAFGFKLPLTMEKLFRQTKKFRLGRGGIFYIFLNIGCFSIGIATSPITVPVIAPTMISTGR